MKKSDMTRAAILDAALGFFWSHPFRDLTVAILMERAGCSRSAFYQYFNDLHELMGVLLEGLREEIFTAAASWFFTEGEPLPLLEESLEGLVRVCYEKGPFLKAIADAAVTDATLEQSWNNFLKSFDQAVATRIEQHQALGYIKPFPAYPMAVALNRLDAALMIEHFGQRPRRQRQATLAAISRIWRSTLYGV